MTITSLFHETTMSILYVRHAVAVLHNYVVIDSGNYVTGDRLSKRQGGLQCEKFVFLNKDFTQHQVGTLASSGISKTELSTDSETILPLTALATENVVYKGEGNANIVIALPHEHTVIRFRKSLPGEVSPDGGRTRVQLEVGYARNVVSCFFGSYVRIPEIVRYDAADIAELSDAIRPLRPEERRDKEIADTYATKFPDYTFLDSQLERDQTVFRSDKTFCVEIKPKQGYLPKAEQEFPGCPYCLNQYSKLRKESIAARSDYCPFDLFSGVEKRMKAVLKKLLTSPQNNLKIFKDGSVVYDQTSSPKDLENILDEWFQNEATNSDGRDDYIDEFCNLIYAALTQSVIGEHPKLPAISLSCNFSFTTNENIPTFCVPPNAIARVERNLRLAKKKCNYDGSELPQNSVLERIWNMQRLSYININYIYSIYSKFVSVLNDDMIYSWSIKSNNTHMSHILLTDTRDNNEDFNENCNVSSNYILCSNTNRTFANGDPVSQTEISCNLDSRQSLHENESNEKSSNDDDKRKEDMQITSEHLSALRNYLLFVAAKDCSILMAFREMHPDNASKMPVENTIKLSEQRYFLTSIRVSDLDPKSVHSIEKHRQRDMNIFDSVIILLEKNIFPVNK